MFLPLSIGIGGSKSGTGKTLFIEKFIRYIKEQLFNQISVIALKYEKTYLYSSIITETSTIVKDGKDTSRIKQAGADLVYLVKATENDLPDIAEKLRDEIFQYISQNNIKKTVLIIEGNSLVKALQPDVIIFLKGCKTEYIKPSGKAILEIADIVIEGKYSMEEVMTEIERVQQKKFIEKLLKERSNDGKIVCQEARKIAEELNVPYIEVGRLANELKIKICKCELGCF